MRAIHEYIGFIRIQWTSAGNVVALSEAEAQMYTVQWECVFEFVCAIVVGPTMFSFNSFCVRVCIIIWKYICTFVYNCVCVCTCDVSVNSPKIIYCLNCLFLYVCPQMRLFFTERRKSMHFASERIFGQWLCG